MKQNAGIQVQIILNKLLVTCGNSREPPTKFTCVVEPHIDSGRRSQHLHPGCNIAFMPKRSEVLSHGHAHILLLDEKNNEQRGLSADEVSNLVLANLRPT